MDTGPRPGLEHVQRPTIARTDTSLYPSTRENEAEPLKAQLEHSTGKGTMKRTKLDDFLNTFKKGVYWSPGQLLSGEQITLRPIPFKQDTEPDSWVIVDPPNTDPWIVSFDIHFGIRDSENRSKSYRCLRAYSKGHGCPFCEWSELAIEGHDKDLVEAGMGLSRKVKVLVHCINVDASSITIAALTQKTIINKILEYIAVSPVDLADENKGRNIIIRRTSNKNPQQWYTVDKGDPEPRPTFTGKRIDLVAEAYKTELLGGPEESSIGPCKLEGKTLIKAIKSARKYLIENFGRIDGLKWK